VSTCHLSRDPAASPLKLTRTAECRIFQKQTVPDIVTELIKKKHARVHVETPLRPREPRRLSPLGFLRSIPRDRLQFRLAPHGVRRHHYFFSSMRSTSTPGADRLADRSRHGARVSRDPVPPPRQQRGDRIDEESGAGTRTRTVCCPGPTRRPTSTSRRRPPSCPASSGSEVERKHEKGMKPDYEIYDQPEPIVHQTGDLRRGPVEEYARNPHRGAHRAI